MKSMLALLMLTFVNGEENFRCTEMAGTGEIECGY
jgi:hypothetical protein